MGKVKLLSCPFCGDEAKIESESWYSQAANTYEMFRVRCDRCDFGLDWHSYERDAIDAWNTRPAVCGKNNSVRDIVARAYADGATECHIYWRQCRPDVVFDREPDFTEAASDYASHFVFFDPAKEDAS